ncbi:hypothetical protein F4808DRAFT_465638 [Astrocystis sublimbata]|nr:hypothetical protein F4808DRAFT_465633 [Astrocystis sublimbata]KAI0190583.1 hypothetical protein F4808DRAFT_465638 [Astrocystis sublimbata]
MESSGDWQPGYWEEFRDDEYQWPPPQQLEHGRIDPTRCALWMKLCIFFQTQKAGVGIEAIDTVVLSQLSVQDGWAFGRDAFYLLAALTGESCRDMSDTNIAQRDETDPSDISRKYIGDLTWARSLSAEKLQNFQASLSEIQQRAWEMLREWWNGDYQDASLAAAVRVFIKEAPAHAIDSIKHRDSLYQAVLFSLFDAELNPSGWTTGTSRGQDRNRSLAFEHAVAQKAGILLLKELRPGFQTLHFLYAGSPTDIYGVRELLREASETASSSTEFILSSGEFSLWITSTWTLQESCLCPDILLLDRAWEPLMIAPGSYVSLHHLLTLYSVNREAYFEQPTRIDDWPLGPEQLHYVQVMVTGLDVAISRVGILTLGATRECERRRADAVMSAINVTDWYTEYLNRHGEPPPDKDLVLGSYPLAFVNEAAAKLGSNFFSTYKADVLTLEPEDVHGSLLPFGPPGWSPSSGLGLDYDWYGDTTDHPSLASWKIGVDGSVVLNEAAVLLSSASNQVGTPIRAVVNSVLEIGGTQVQEYDLYEYLSSSSTPPGRTRLAVVTTKIRDVMSGIILQELSLSSSSPGSGACWAKIGEWETRFVREFPPTESLRIKVL